MLSWLLLLIACDVPYRVPKVPVDAGEFYTVAEAWQRVRSEVRKPKACFADRQPYCLTDRWLIDAAIQEDLDTHFHGRMPLNERWCDEVIGRARAGWNERMRERPQAVEGLVAANWASPAVERKGGRVDVKLFVPPGTLKVKNDWRLQTSLDDRGQLASAELAAQLERYRHRYANAPVVRLLIDIPIQGGIDFKRWDVRHYRDLDRVVVVDPLDKRGGWVSARLQGDFGPYVSGAASLHTTDLERCALGKKVLDPPDCTRHPKAPPSVRKKRAKSPVGRAGWDPASQDEM